MTKTFTKFKKENKNIFITGDFNLNLLCANKKEEIFQFLDLMYLHFLQPHIIYPSRIVKNAKPSLLDNILSSHIDNELYSGNIIDKITDHMPNFLILPQYKKSETKMRHQKRDYKHFNEEKFLQDLPNTRIANKIYV